MQQLILDLVTPRPPAFDNFVVGRNAEVVAALQGIADGGNRETCTLLWGVAGAGKSHLLRAVATAARSRGVPALAFDEPAQLAAADIEAAGSSPLLLVDAIDRADAEAQAWLFTVFNLLRAGGGQLVAASRSPPSALPLREDLRSRLCWGPAYEVLPLADDDKPDALLAWARQRDLALSEAVIHYLLAHARRDMAALVATLEALDRHSLSTKRPITVPLLRSWLQGEIPLPP